MTTLQRSFDFAATAPPPSRRNLVIEAGAGTGKTTAIVAEVLKLMLEREDLAPERIVLMTFTEKAAAEIADRVRGALEELGQQLSVGSSPSSAISWPIDSPHPLIVIDDRQRARRAINHHLANIDALRSQTIHSFCQSLLRSFPLEAQLDPQFKIIEGFERSLLYGQLYDAWIDEETRVHPTEEIVREWELLFTHVGYLFQIRELILTLINRRDLLAEEGYDFGDFAEIEASLVEAVVWARRETAPIKDVAARTIAQYLRCTPFDGGDIDAWIDYLRPIARSMREIDLRYCGPLKTPMSVLRAGKTGRSIHDRLVSHRAAMSLLAMTRRFIAYLDAEKRKLGVVDFDDLLLRTLALLDDPTVLERARAQFDFIFVDEFQDTDRTQARIVDRLARDASGRYVPGKTIIVGDPKQSIYGFRRADPETYYRLAESLESDGAEHRLIRDQYRSDAPLLDVINSMFSRLFPEESLHDPNVFRPTYHPLRAARSAPRREMDARVTMLHAEHDAKGDRYLVEAAAIAQWILKNRDGGQNDLQRFAILFRRLTKIDDYLDTLDRFGIDYVLPPTRLFLDRRAPVDLLAVLRAIAWPFDVGAQVSAARTPYFALTDLEIVRKEDPWNAFATAIEELRAASRHLTVSALIDLVISTASIESVYAEAADGTRNLRHLEHVRGIAFAYDQRVGGSVRQFVEEISRRRSEPEETEPSLVDESKNAVRIMSVHGAKGLEFETVILPDLAFPTITNESLQLFTVEEPRSIVLCGRADSISGNFRYSSDGEKLKTLGGRREEAEVRRLFYVAVTRAKTDVVFVCNLGDETKNVGFLKCLGDALGLDRNGLAALWPPQGREIRETAIGPMAFEKVDVGEAGQKTRRRLRDEELEAQLASGDLVPLDIAPAGVVAQTLASSEIAARRAGSRNRAAGILLHRVLELWDGQSDIEPLVRQLAVETAAEPEAIARVRQRLSTIARSPMLQRIAAAETVGREVTVRFAEEGTIVERRIDRLLRESDRHFVIDYKSGVAEPARVEKDRAQVERYCRAVSAITGRECGGAIWYVDLENEDVVVI